MSMRPDAQAFDEIRIRTVPRYKESELSGDEWRISASVDFYRNGNIVHTVEGYRNVEVCCNLLPFFHSRACDDGHAYFASIDDICDQEGCGNIATVRYQKIDSYCREGHKTTPHSPEYRQFCEHHKTRGDCGLDDADQNYHDEPVPI